MTRKVPDAHVGLKRAYDDPRPEDGMRILVDRLWPRGLKRESAAIDLWAKDLAPSTELRKWFGHKPERWSEFKRRYTAELHMNAERLDELRDLARRRHITLVYAAKDQDHNQAIVIHDLLLG